MTKRKQSTRKSGKTAFVVGRASFERISAVEGIKLKPAMDERAAEARRKGLSAEEYRKEILRAHRKS